MGSLLCGTKLVFKYDLDRNRRCLVTGKQHRQDRRTVY